MERKITQEQRQQILQEYLEGKLTICEIAERYGISGNTVSAIAVRAGVQLRRPKKPQAGVKVCPKCRKKVDTIGARFCPFCGSDIRSENELLAEKLDGLLDLYQFIPAAQRDEFVQTINKAAAALKTQK